MIISSCIGHNCHPFIGLLGNQSLQFPLYFPMGFLFRQTYFSCFYLRVLIIYFMVFLKQGRKVCSFKQKFYVLNGNTTDRMAPGITKMSFHLFKSLKTVRSSVSISGNKLLL